MRSARSRVIQLRIEVLQLEKAVLDGDYGCCELSELRDALDEAREGLVRAEGDLNSGPVPGGGYEAPFVRSGAAGLPVERGTGRPGR